MRKLMGALLCLCVGFGGTLNSLEDEEQESIPAANETSVDNRVAEFRSKLAQLPKEINFQFFRQIN